MTQLHLNIKQQIKLLPLDESLRTRILELTMKNQDNLRELL
jgi:hypothetical protein